MALTDAIRVLVLGAGRQFPVLGVAGLRVLFSDDEDAQGGAQGLSQRTRPSG